MIRQQPEAQPTQDDTPYTNAILDRLVERYLVDSPLPGNNRELSITLFHRLYRYVMLEGYEADKQGNSHANNR